MSAVSAYTSKSLFVGLCNCVQLGMGYPVVMNVLLLTCGCQSSTGTSLIERVFFPQDIQYTGKSAGQIITLGFVWLFFFF